MATNPDAAKLAAEVQNKASRVGDLLQTGVDAAALRIPTKQAETRRSEVTKGLSEVTKGLEVVSQANGPKNG